ncbi:putative low complexity [Cryptosporidium sp. chipmunk genotype I]|uniref:putative low complexity n=1 Tax=Cryptosporidium sp. chipmunk genotype I TaxID=1280935 RepID=UPI00351A030D|nr:putative low complexity [Cryptosporidium sp. chipmunk genotype I]
MFRETSVYSNSTKYTVQICFDQPYYYSSEKIRCNLKVFYERFDQYNENLEGYELLDYITIQLFGYASFSNELLNFINSNSHFSASSTASPSSINQFISNIFSLTSRLDRLGIAAKQSSQKNKPIFVSNPYILVSDVKISKSKDEIGTFMYTCFLPPFIPPTFTGKLISFNYTALVTIGINNKMKLERPSHLFDFIQTAGVTNQDLRNKSLRNSIPTIQKKLKFDIKCLGPHPRSSGLIFSPIKRSGIYHPITALNNNYYHSILVDDFNSVITNSSEKIPSIEATTSYRNICEVSEIEFLSASGNNPKLILDHLNSKFQRKSLYLKAIQSQNEFSIPKMRFFELHDNIDIYSCLNTCPKSLLEVYWENEVTIIHSPGNLRTEQILHSDSHPFKSFNNSEILNINYKNELVAICRISNSNSWSSSNPIIIHFDLFKSYWKTQEIHIKLKRIEIIRQNSQDLNGIQNQIIVYSYKKCTLWDLEFSHQINPLSSFLIQSMDSDIFYVYYQLSFDFFVYNTEKKLKQINYLDVNRFPNLIKLSWNSSPINYYGQSQKLLIQSTDKIDSLSNISSYFHPLFSILPNNNVYVSKSIEF